MPFLNPTVLGRQIKEAHKSDKLKVGILERSSLEDGLAIFCKNTLYWIEEYAIPNKIKAALIEYVGFMPKRRGVVYEASQEGGYQEVDPEITDKLQERIKAVDNANGVYHQTSLIAVEIVSHVRLMQSEEDLTILGVREEYLGVISLKDLIEDEESPPVGPNFHQEDGLMCYTNATTIFGCQAYMIGASRKFKSIVDTLELIDLKDPE